MAVDVHKVGQLGVELGVCGQPRIIARLVKPQFVKKDSAAVGTTVRPVSQTDAQLLDRLHRGVAPHSVYRWLAATAARPGKNLVQRKAIDPRVIPLGPEPLQFVLGKVSLPFDRRPPWVTHQMGIVELACRRIHPPRLCDRFELGNRQQIDVHLIALPARTPPFPTREYRADDLVIVGRIRPKAHK